MYMKKYSQTTGDFVTYQAVLAPEPDGSAYNVRVPALSGCFTFGATPEEALDMAREAIELTVESMMLDEQRRPRQTTKVVALQPNEFMAYITVELPRYGAQTASSDRTPAHA